MNARFARLALLVLSSLLSQAFALAAPAPKQVATDALDSFNCKIRYNDSATERGLKRKCKNEKVESDYFALDDTSAPLLQKQTFKIGQHSYLATRWQTGASQEIVIFDLGKEKGEPPFRVVSDGPSTYSFDAKNQRIKIVAVNREQPLATSEPVSKTYYWPPLGNAQ